jgi:demethylmenaquinone methyltransferase/2-methoxy-6-polyprenyl-1,4-benzoquinol methylase
VSRDEAVVRTNYDRLSRVYDLLAGRAESRTREVGLLKLGVQSGETVLEIGLGTGQALLGLARAVGPQGHVFGVDLSRGMLAVAGERLTEAGLGDRVTFIHGDARSLPIEDDTCSAVFMSFALELFSEQDIPVVLTQCRRALKVEGRICVVAMASADKPGLMLRLYEWSHRRWPGVVDCRPILVQENLRQAGFKVLDATCITMYGLPVEVVLARRPD